MRNVATFGLAASFLAAAFASAPRPAAAADYIRPYAAYYDEGSRICAESWTLARISGKFRYQVTHVPHLPDVDIVDFRNIHQNRFLPAREDRPIARRYCEATAYMSDGRRHTVWYLIEYGAGFAGLGSNVEFCMMGFDRWHVYDGRCRVLR